MYAPGPKSPLRDLEAAPLAQEYVRRRHAHVLESDLRVSVRRVVVTEDLEQTHDLNALCIQRHEDHRLLLMFGRVWTRLPHHDCDPAARIARAARPPLAPVDDVLVAVAHDARANVGRIRRSHVRLGHGEAGTHLEHFHVAGVGRATVEDLRRKIPSAPHQFSHRRVFKIG